MSLCAVCCPLSDLKYKLHCNKLDQTRKFDKDNLQYLKIVISIQNLRIEKFSFDISDVSGQPLTHGCFNQGTFIIHRSLYLKCKLYTSNNFKLMKN